MRTCPATGRRTCTLTATTALGRVAGCCRASNRACRCLRPSLSLCLPSALSSRPLSALPSLPLCMPLLRRSSARLLLRGPCSVWLSRPLWSPLLRRRPHSPLPLPASARRPTRPRPSPPVSPLCCPPLPSCPVSAFLLQVSCTRLPLPVVCCGVLVCPFPVSLLFRQCRCLHVVQGCVAIPPAPVAMLACLPLAPCCRGRPACAG